MRPLVSMVVPCYNVEKKIVNLLESVLKQTYTNIEAIFVDDGSTDKTKEVIFSYKEKLEALGINFNYILQENQGAAGAIRTGLEYVTGKYLIWPDADDILMETSIEKKVEFLETNSEYSMVRTNAYIIDSDNIEEKSKLALSAKQLKRSKIFEECIRFKSFYCPGIYMIRWQSFLNINPDKYIYPTYSGQNIQMIVPMAYHYMCGYIDEPLYGYVIYKDSHSRLGGNKTYERKIKQSKGLEDIVVNTLKRLNLGTVKDLKNIKNDFAIRRLQIAYVNDKKEDKKLEYAQMSRLSRCNPVFIMAMKMKKNKFVDTLLDFYNKAQILKFKLKNKE